MARAPRSPREPRAPRSRRETRTPLTKERILRAAMELVHEEGLQALSMRKLGERLGVEAMSLYNHVENKDDILDGVTDLVLSEIELPVEGDDWRTAMRRRAVSAREVLTRYPWAVALLDARTNPGMETLRYFDSVMGCLRGAGFSIELAVHAFWTLDSYIYGFQQQQVNLPLGDVAGEVAEEMLSAFPVDAFPHLAEVAATYVAGPSYSFDDEFGFGLELILDGLERRLNAESGG